MPTVVVRTGTGDVQAVSGAGTLHGWSARESAGTAAAATVVLRDGTSTAGAPVASIELGPNARASERIPSVGFGTGLYVDRVAGETELSLYVG